LTHEAARQTFSDVADNVHDERDVEQLLLLTDNLPLAVDLIAHLADYEGCQAVLARWKTEKISLLSQGYDRRSNLDISISLSISCSRMTDGAKDLLSLLSLLPDGLSNVELLQSSLPIKDVLECKTTLLRTSLAYIAHNNRLMALVPVREYMQYVYPPSQLLVASLRKHFDRLIQLYVDYQGLQTGSTFVDQLISNHGNIQNILLLGLQPDSPDCPDTLISAMSFSSFNRKVNQGYSALTDQILLVAPKISDHKVQACFIREQFNFWHIFPIHNPEALITQAHIHFSYINNSLEEGESI
jgi:hypothetical protein